MYRQSPTGQLSFENFYLPFGGKLSGENRWIRLSELVPWETFESEYAEQFSQGQGAPANQGKFLLDATVAPADIRYPTDIKLLNEAREQTGIAIDALYKQVKEQLPKKPRTYRRGARTAYLQIAKQRKPNRKKIRKALRQQLAYVRRNLAHIDSLIAAGAIQLLEVAIDPNVDGKSKLDHVSEMKCAPFVG